MVAGTYRPERCGVAHYTERLRSALDERGVSSLVLTTGEAARASSDPHVRGVVRGWGLSDLPALVRAVRGAVRDEGADVVHVQHAAGTYGFKRAVFFLPPLLRAAGCHEGCHRGAQDVGAAAGQVGPRGRLLAHRKRYPDHDELPRGDRHRRTTTVAGARVRRIPLVANVDVAPVEL